MKIKEYENVWRKECTHLSTVVKEYIKNGWQPFGGVASTHVWDEKTKDLICWHGQAMVKYEECREKIFTCNGQVYAVIENDSESINTNPTASKERKVVDCFATEFLSSYVADKYEKSILDDDDWWETIFKKEGKLKMVKYE